MLGRRKKSSTSCFCSSDSRHPDALNPFRQAVRGGRHRPHTQYFCLATKAPTRRGETLESSASPQAPKKDRPRFPFHSFFSSSLFFFLLFLLFFSLVHTPTSLPLIPLIRPVCAFFSAFHLRFLYILAPFDPLFLLLPLSLVNISLTSSFVQAPVRVLGLGRQPLSSQFHLFSLRFFLHSYSRARRLPVSRRTTMSASGDDMPLIKSNGKFGELLSVTPVNPVFPPVASLACDFFALRSAASNLTSTSIAPCYSFPLGTCSCANRRSYNKSQAPFPL